MLHPRTTRSTPTASSPRLSSSRSTSRHPRAWLRVVTGACALACFAPDTAAAANGPEGEGDRDNEPILHRGFVFAPELGTIGCTRNVCAGSQGHDAMPGFTAGGFLGGNIGGIFEIGLAGHWGQLNAQVGDDANALGLYGINRGDIPSEAAAVGFDYDDYQTSSARLTDARVGAAVRLHFIPRGRVAAYVGSGFGYHLFRGDYTTRSGPARLAFHGLDIPAQAGIAVYINRRIAVGAKFDYLWTYFAAVNARHPSSAPDGMVAPLGVVEQQLERRDKSLTDNLPQFWTATLGFRVTL